ncbi:MAG: hypothetical protein HGA19_09225 [Oscillochloris sp.]|nr:hypothetical protein [Oscillochloris sp.]
MLPKILIGPGLVYRGLQDDDWNSYVSRIGDHVQTIDHEFLTQICFEHGERFDRYFPRFDLEIHAIQRRRVTASEIRDHVRYDDNETVDFWAFQFDRYRTERQPHDYMVFKHMSTSGTWPFPPVIIDNSVGFADSLSKRSLGRPWHLIEGTHRVSYLNRMLELDLIAPSSEHEIIWLCG